MSLPTLLIFPDLSGFYNSRFDVPSPGHVFRHSNAKVSDGRYIFKLSTVKGVITPSRE